MLKYKKKLIYGALALFIGQICFFWLWWIGVQNQVFADEGGQQSTISEKVSKRLNTAKFLQKLVYVLIYPLLVVAGKLVDNSFVYGEIFWFDAVLWNLWVTVRNIANFALWFILIYYMFKNLVSPDSKHNAKWLITRTFIAWLWIQASWFIMAALIDISTILIYWVWWLPITVLWTEESNENNHFVLNTIVSIESNDIDSFYVYLSNPESTQFISECETFSYDIWASGANNTGLNNTWLTAWAYELIVAPKMTYYKSGSTWWCYGTILTHCHLWGQVYKFWGNDFSRSSWVHISNAPNSNDCTAWWDFQNKYGTELSNWKSRIPSEDIGPKVDAGGILYAWVSSGDFWLDEMNQSIWTQWNSLKMDQVLSGSYAWVFGALYGSLLSAGNDLRISANAKNSIYISLINTALSLGHMIAIWIPLIAMAVVFMIRICVLRLAIALSPVIVLLKAFDMEEYIDKMNVNFLKYLKVENLIWIIFSPAVICFAISISTVLVRIIMDKTWQDIDTIKKPILWWLVTMDIAWMWINIWKMVMAVLWIAVTRFLVWAAVTSSEIWKSSFMTRLKTLAESSLWAMPIVPVPWKNGQLEFMGVDTVFGSEKRGRQGILSQYSNNLEKKYNDENNDAFKQLFETKDERKQKAAELRAKWYWTNLLALANAGGLSGESRSQKAVTIWDENNKTTVKFSDLNDKQQGEILTNINKIEDNNVRKELWNKDPKITIWDKTYVFREETLINNKEEEITPPYQYMTDEEYNKYLKDKKLSRKTETS